MNSIIKRYLPFAMLSAIVLYVAFTPSMVRTMLDAAAACLLVVIMAELAQFFYTKIDWTDASTDSADHSRALGYIYLGTSMVVGLVYLGVFFLNFLSSMSNR